MTAVQLTLALLGVLAVSFISFAGVFTLTIGASFMQRLVFGLVSLSVGALFGDAFLHLLPEAFRSATDPKIAGLVLFLGVLLFFALEKFLHWHHSHTEGEIDREHPEHNVTNPFSTIVLVGDGVHNFIDGVIIGIAFLVSPEVGVATLAAIALHEIPQEIGDFGLLIHGGFTRRKALISNFISALVALLGVLAVYMLGEGVADYLSYALAFAAGGFIYIAGSDLVPELHKTREVHKSVIQVVFITLGFAVMFALALVE